MHINLALDDVINVRAARIGGFAEVSYSFINSVSGTFIPLAGLNIYEPSSTREKAFLGYMHNLQNFLNSPLEWKDTMRKDSYGSHHLP